MYLRFRDGQAGIGIGAPRISNFNVIYGGWTAGVNVETEPATPAVRHQMLPSLEQKRSDGGQPATDDARCIPQFEAVAISTAGVN